MYLNGRMWTWDAAQVSDGSLMTKICPFVTKEVEIPDIMDEIRSRRCQRAYRHHFYHRGETPMDILSMHANGIPYQNDTRTQKAEKPYIDGSYAEKKIETEKKAPYSYMADASGKITYKGVTFLCDDYKKTISLGDVSDPKKTLTVPLESGGCLLVNRGDLDELSHAITMFSAEDVSRILSAIAQDRHCTQKEFEIEDEDTKTVMGATDTVQP